MVDIGNTLREARRARGLTLEEVEEETKIRKKYIMALEMEQFEVLPGPIYAKAFLKNYAKFLRVDLDEIMEAFKQKQAGEAVHEEQEKPVEEKRVRAARRKIPYGLYAAALLLIAVVVVAVAYGTGVLWPDNNAANDGGQQATEQTDTGENDAQQPPPQVNPAGIDGVKIDLNVTTGRSWVLVTVDGVQAFQGELAAGESRSYTGKEKITVRLGNAGVVEVLENEKSLGSLGPVGAVVEREFKAPAAQ